MDHSAHGAFPVPRCTVRFLDSPIRNEVDNPLFCDFKVVQHLIKWQGIKVGMEFLCKRAELVPIEARFRKIDPLSLRIPFNPLLQKVIPTKGITYRIVDTHLSSLAMSLKGCLVGFLCRHRPEFLGKTRKVGLYGIEKFFA